MGEETSSPFQRMRSIYFDNAATTQVSPGILAELPRVLQDCCGNPSSIHAEGRKSRKLVEDSRRSVSELLGCRANEVYFTSGGSESDTWALYGTAHAPGNHRRTLITSQIEHKAVLSCSKRLESEGYNVIYLPVDPNGVVSADSLKRVITEDVFLVSIMSVNNETGVIQDIDALSEIAHLKGALFHTDAVQGIYDVEYKLANSQIDMLSLSAHKLHGLKGCGVLTVRSGIDISKLIYGGAQEQGKRAGTENLPGIYSLGIACRDIMTNRDAINSRKRKLSGLLEELITSRIEDLTVNSASARRAGGISNISFRGVDGEALMLNLDLKGVCASTGSACLSGSVDPSHVLMAMGIEKEIAAGSVRFSFSEYNTEEEVYTAADIICETVKKLRNMNK